MNTRYTILTTFPGLKSSSNVGDQLIEIALKRLVAREKGKVGFLTIFREEHLEPFLDEINTTAAILLPGFGIRAAVPIYPDVVRLVEDLDRIKVPIIPIGTNWNLYTEDARGVGFNDTFGVGGFDGFRRVGNSPRRPPREGGTSGYCVTQEEFDAAPARDDVVTEVRQFVEKELDVAFCGYLGIAPFIDETYEKIMGPFLRSLP